MDHDSRNRLSPEARAVNVAAASGADMVVNFPLWIAAKRLSAGLPLPRLGEIYKGSGALYLAFFPMMVVEDWATGVVDRTLGGRLGDESRHLVSACASGPAAAVLVGSQVEGLITRAHGVGHRRHVDGIAVVQHFVQEAEDEEARAVAAAKHGVARADGRARR